jgi:hypothetical protein
MKNPIYKETYRGHGIYWHGGNSYGDETIVTSNSIAGCRTYIDTWLVKVEAGKNPVQRYWDTLSHVERQKYRRACQYTDQTAAEMAYTSREMRN